MRKHEKSEASELDIIGLLALKKFERPDVDRTEKNIQNTMRAVRATSNVPSLLLFPDKSFAWMFAQPRYGVAALFVIFLGLHLLDRPIPVSTDSPVAASNASSHEIMVSADTNQLKSATIPGIEPPFSIAGEPALLSSFLK